MGTKTDPDITNFRLTYLPQNVAGKGYESNLDDFPNDIFIKNSDLDAYWRELKSAQLEIFTENGVEKTEDMIFTVTREAVEKAKDETNDENLKKLSNALLKDNRFECVAGLEDDRNPLGITLPDLKALGTRKGNTNPDYTSEVQGYTIRKDDFDWLDLNKQTFLSNTYEQLDDNPGQFIQTYVENNCSNIPDELENITILPSQNDTLEVSYDSYDGKTDTNVTKKIGELLNPDLYTTETEETDW